MRGLATRLRERGIEPLVSREPGSTPAGDRLRDVLLDAHAHLDPMTELFVVCAARSEHVARVIGPAIDAGRIVLCDRFGDATVAYQGYGRGLDLGVVRFCSDLAARGLQPDLTLLVDVSVDVSQRRIRERATAGEASDRLDNENASFYRRVRGGYHTIASEDPARVRVLDGTLPPQALLEAAWSHIAALAKVDSAG